MIFNDLIIKIVNLDEWWVMAVGRWRVKIIGWMMVILVRFYVYCSNQVAVCFERPSEKTSFFRRSFEGLPKETRTKPAERWWWGDEVQDLRFEIRGSRFEIRGSRFEVQGSRFEIRSLKFEVRGLRFEIWDSRFEIRDLRFEVWGLRYEVQIRKSIEHR